MKQIFATFILVICSMPVLSEPTESNSKNVIEQEVRGDASSQPKTDSRCMMVCMKWGEDCVIDPKTNTKTCRRVCKEFGEKCF